MFFVALCFRVRAITGSKKILVFISKGMDEDEWAQYAVFLTHNFSPAGQRPKLAIVKVEDCDILKNFAIFNLIDYSTEAGKDYFWRKVYMYCTGERLGRYDKVPGIESNSKQGGWYHFTVVMSTMHTV